MSYSTLAYLDAVWIDQLALQIIIVAGENFSLLK